MSGRLSDVIRAVENITPTYTLKVERGYVSFAFPFPGTKSQPQPCKCGGGCTCKEEPQTGDNMAVQRRTSVTTTTSDKDAVITVSQEALEAAERDAAAVRESLRRAKDE